MKRSSFIFVYFVLILSTLLVFWQVRNFDFVNYDDDLYVYENQHILNGLTQNGIIWAFTTGHASNWHPLTWLSLMLDCQLFGTNAGWIHLINLFLHLANTLLLFAVLRKITGSLWPSAFVAAAFAIHPMHVESVAWIAERKDVLSALFWLLTLAAYVGYVKRPSIFRYLISLVLFAIGLMVKPMLVTLPFLLLLLDYWPLDRFAAPRAIKTAAIPDRRRVLYRIIIEKIPFFALSAVSSVITFIVQKGSGAVMDVNTLSLQKGGANAFLSYAKYIGKMFWPQNLAVFYPFDADSFAPWQMAMCVLLLLVISIFVIRFGRKQRYLPVGWFWFLGTLVPVIGFVQVGEQSLADRYTYIPYIGLFIIIAWGLPELLSKWPQRKIALGISMVIVLTTLGICAHQQISYWNKSTALFSHAIEVTQNNYIAYNNLGIAYGSLGRHQDAIETYKQAIKIKPNYAMAYNNRGGAYVDLGRWQEAIEDFSQAIRIKPDYAMAHCNLGAAYGMLGRYQEAIDACKQAIRIKPDLAEVHYNLGVAYGKLGRYQDAVESYKQAIRIKPDDAKAHCNLGAVYHSLGRYQDAIDACKQAIRIKPDLTEAYNNLGIVMKAQGNYDEAIENFARVVQLQPDAVEPRNDLALLIVKHPELKDHNIEEAISLARRTCELTNYRNAAFLDTMALAYSSAGRFSEAVNTAQAALNIDPNLASAHRVLGAALLSDGYFKKAMVHIKRSLEIEPNSIGAKNNLAWILATSPDPNIRNSSDAIRLAQEACNAVNSNDPTVLDTLGAAYASGGRFADAVETAQKALDLADGANQVQIKNTIQHHLVFYKQNKPYVESVKEVIYDVNKP
jgi:tetratricopeptide (TPR) repeat protein